VVELFIIFFFVFGAPAIVVISALKLRSARQLKELEVQRLALLAQQPLQLPAPNPEVEQRIQNLESIVCSVDFELNAKLNRLASRQLQLAPPADPQQLAETKLSLTGGIEPGSRVGGRFVVDRLLGAGGMGAVFLARDEQLGETVALKVIAGGGVLDPAAADRFRREASAARRISHTNVVRIHDIGEAMGMLFLSMEYIAGTSLAALLDRHRTLAFDQLRSLVAQICFGLAAAHEAGVIHRDLKPANILVDESQHVKIIDFGLAALPHLEGMTATGMILGTPEYMAPEQIRGRPVDPRTDIYALGALMYHAMVGHPPFTGDTPIAVGFAHCVEDVTPPHEVDSTIPEPWSALVVRALAKDPAQRFDTMDELAAALPAT